MKKVIILLVAVAVVYGLDLTREQSAGVPVHPTTGESSNAVLKAAYENRQGDLQVQGQGRVVRILPDDRDGSRHQRFILELATGQRLLIAHNIDLAPRVSGISEGDTVEFFGEYEWNDKGGVIHWTHRDPNGRHIDGWLKHGVQTYQ